MPVGRDGGERRAWVVYALGMPDESLENVMLCFQDVNYDLIWLR